MKKFIIIAAVILTTGATTLSFSRKEDKVVKSDLKIEKAEMAKVSLAKSDVATAD